MSQFAPALTFLLSNEDYTPPRYENAIDNNGGGVIAGINSKSFPDQYAAIAALPQDQRADAVYKFYFAYFWTPMGLGAIDSQDVATRVLDMGVNAGTHTSVQLLQQAVNSLGNTIAEDGKIGPATIAAANACDPTALLAAFREQRENHYQMIVAKNPANQRYLAGWLARASK